MLSRGAFNALLKTLEEPPAHVKFILATTEAEKVPTTILSRCQRYDFRNIPGREIADHLREICKKEKIEADDDALLMVARAGAGSMRDSLSLLDRLFSVGEKRVTVELIEQLLGLPKAQAVYELTQAIGDGKVGDVLERVDALITGGLSAESLLAALIDHLRNLLLVRTCGVESKLVEAVGVSPKDLAQQAQNFDPVSLTQDITLLEELRRQIRTAHAGRALLDASLVRLALAEQFTAIDQLLAQQSPGAAPAASVQKKKPELSEGSGFRIQGSATQASAPPAPAPAAVPSDPIPEPRTPNPEPSDEDDDLPRPGKVWDNSGPSLSELLKQQSPKPVAATAATPVSNVEPVSLTNLPKVWKDFLAHLTAKKELGIYGMLSQGRLTAIEGGQAVIKFPTDVAMRMADRRRDQVLSHFGEFSRQEMGVRFEVDATIAETPAPAAAVPAPSRPAAAHKPAAAAPQHLPPLPGATQVKLTPELMEKLQEVPLVKGVMEQLGGTIIRVTEEN
jgi:DNA polymerase-3 subunit gamma/tau